MGTVASPIKINLVLKKPKLVLNLLTVRHLKLDLTTVLLQLERRKRTT